MKIELLNNVLNLEFANFLEHFLDNCVILFFRCLNYLLSNFYCLSPKFIFLLGNFVRKVELLLFELLAVLTVKLEMDLVKLCIDLV
jgi:hypothetical protein